MVWELNLLCGVCGEYKKVDFIVFDRKWGGG
jgi:hypothetical protein